MSIHSKKIGILGTGIVGTTLADGFVNKGFDVLLSARDAGNEKVAEWVKKHDSPKARGGSFADAAVFGDIVIIAVTGSADVVQSALKAAGSGLDGKVLIDTTNPIKFEPDFGPIYVAAGVDSSLGETVQNAAPKALVVKAYNTITNKHMIDPPRFGDSKGSFFLAGNSKDAKAVVTELVKATGWEDVVDCGDIRSSRTLEPLCLLWLKIVFDAGWNMDKGFKLLQK